PMRGHGLMQAIARVNRVFREKPGGLIVAYLGLADQLRDAVGTYTASGGSGSPSYDVAQAVAVLQEKYDVACDLLHGYDWQQAVQDPRRMLGLLPGAQQHILEQEDGKKRFVQVVTELSRAFAL
ncbi:MAG: type I restriction enzyme endonuclease domain-containing protein, partial [Planctomycetaceae bacterium]